jgi:hypothetical protein
MAQVIGVVKPERLICRVAPSFAAKHAYVMVHPPFGFVRIGKR